MAIKTIVIDLDTAKNVDEIRSIDRQAKLVLHPSSVKPRPAKCLRNSRTRATHFPHGVANRKTSSSCPPRFPGAGCTSLVAPTGESIRS